ncbi:MAG: hypothetical protein U9R48_01115 [Chloroflexota bacterium]|nr:hypothetical protein [Chloroflexota bacterium]
MEDGEWEIEVALPPAGTPGTMNPGEASRAMYVVRAMAEGHPKVEAARFPFDLYGPPSE